MERWTLEILYRRFEECVKGVTAKLLRGLDEEGMNRLLLEKADELFRGGRYNQLTEWCLEMYKGGHGTDAEDTRNAEEALRDLGQISRLTDAQRTKLQFYKRLKELCVPLFCLRPLPLDESPFGMKDGSFSIKNPELRSFLYESPYPHLSVVMCEVLKRGYTYECPSHIMVREALGDKFFYELHEGDMKDENLREKLDGMVDLLLTVDNHLEVGRRLGLSPQAQAIYDMTDTFICREYDYRQVDYAKEMDAWITANWVGCEHPEGEAVQQLLDAMDACACRHGVHFVDRQGTGLYLMYDLLGMSPTEKKYDEEDDWELEDE